MFIKETDQQLIYEINKSLHYRLYIGEHQTIISSVNPEIGMPSLVVIKCFDPGKFIENQDKKLPVIEQHKNAFIKFIKANGKRNRTIKK